jgi:hypothetical protein
MNLYPFKFEPILKPVIWGGSEICMRNYAHFVGRKLKGVFTLS